MPFGALALRVICHKVSSTSNFFLATEFCFMATLLQLKVAKRRFFEKVSSERCYLVKKLVFMKKLPASQQLPRMMQKQTRLDTSAFQSTWWLPCRLVTNNGCHFHVEAHWPNGQCASSQSERSRFEPWPGTLCCVLGQDTQLSHCLSPPRSINGYRRIAGGT